MVPYSAISGGVMGKTNIISYNEYMRFIQGICYNYSNLIEEEHKKLIGKVCEDEEGKVIDCGIGFIQKVFNESFKIPFVDFLNSSHLSDYFKNGIKQLILQERPGYIIANTHRILEKGNMIDSTTDAELYDIFALIRKNYMNGSSNKARMERLFDEVFNEFVSLSTEKSELLKGLTNSYNYGEIVSNVSDDELKEILSFIRNAYQKMISQSRSVDSIIALMKSVLLEGAPNEEVVKEFNFQLNSYNCVYQDFETTKKFFEVLREIYKNNSEQRERIDGIVKYIIDLFSEKEYDADIKEALDILKRENVIENLTDDELKEIQLQLRCIALDTEKGKGCIRCATEIIKELLPIELACNDNPSILCILNSNRQINDMSEEEIKTIYSVIAGIIISAKNNGRNINSIAKSFVDYLFRLNGSGVASFIVNNIDRRLLANYILNVSGINIDVNSYMLGYGVDLRKLNQDNLFTIFLQLFSWNKDYAIEFANMVMSMKVLDVTAFINTFNSFVVNEFRIDEAMIATDEDYADIYSRTEDITPVLLSEMFDFPTKQDSFDLTDDIKRAFLFRIKLIMEKSSPDFVKKYYESNGEQK